MTLACPWPWYGGKRRWAADIVTRFGDIKVYAEPFSGSLAVLLASPKREREIACDLDGMVVNAWRAIQGDPDAVACWADYPTFHDDLTARRYWLADWRDDNRQRLVKDALYFDAQAAGWWIYCVSSWIGGAGQMLSRSHNRMPHVKTHVGGQGVQVQRRDLASEQIPKIRDGQSGFGVQVQRRDLASDKIPHVVDRVGGKGVQAQRTALEGRIGTGERLSDWMYALADRLAGVIILNRDWTSAVTPTLLQHTATAPKPPVGVFLDPPYLEEERTSDLYESDGKGNNPARAAYEWALEHGDVYRIAYACHAGDFDVPKGWETMTRSFSGIKDAERLANGKDDLIMFSPACVNRQAEQGKLL